MDKNIKKLISKFDKPKKSNDKKKKCLTGDDLAFEKFGLFQRIPYRPPKPPKAVGFLEKMGCFVINYNTRYLEIDPMVGSFRKFNNIEDYPNIPK
jgi:hypothetical protein